MLLCLGHTMREKGMYKRENGQMTVASWVQWHRNSVVFKPLPGEDIFILN